MNNKSVVNALIIFTIGAAVGFFVGKKKYEDYYAEVADEEIKSVIDSFSKRGSEDDGEKVNGLTDDEYEERFRTAPNSLDRSSVADNPYEKAKRNYNLVSPEDEEVVRKLHGVKPEVIIVDELAGVDRTKPYRIGEQDFLNETDGHDKVSLLYYRHDDILCEENEDVIEHIEATIGVDAIEALETVSKVWVRNEPLTIDYEIVALDMSYEEREDNEE